jgi:hypothetical protein
MESVGVGPNGERIEGDGDGRVAALNAVADQLSLFAEPSRVADRAIAIAPAWA